MRKKTKAYFGYNSNQEVDPLQPELRISGRGADNATNLIDLLVKLNVLLVQDNTPCEDGTFWTNTLYRLLENDIKLLIISGDESRDSKYSSARKFDIASTPSPANKEGKSFEK